MPAGAAPGAGRASGAPERRTDRVVFTVPVLSALAIVVWGMVATDALERVTAAMLVGTMRNGGWAFVLAASGFVVFSLWLAVSRYGRITLGKEGERPEFRTVSWVAMMFSAGIGTALMFYGVNEPLTHFNGPPPGTGGSAPEQTRTAMATTLFHWTLYPWAVFAVVGLAVAYSCFRRGRRQTISGAFTPLIGERNANGALGRVIDILAIFATVLGAAASLGLGALQIASGIREAGRLPAEGIGTLMAVVAVLTTAFVAYATSSAAMGIQRLSNINMVLATLLVVFVFLAGPTVTILNLLPTSAGSFIGDLPQMAARTDLATTGGAGDWLAGWTLFYWAWWVSWAPLMGMFIARISRGRTIRQFVGGVVLVPSAVSLVWFATFGGAAIGLERGGAAIAEVSTAEGQFFAVLREYPVSGATTVIALVLMGVFYVSSADAASTVAATLSQRGTLRPASNAVVLWGVLIGTVAAFMLFVGGGSASGLEGLRNLTIVGGVPFVILMAGMCAALVRDLRRDPLMRLGERGARALEAAVTEGEARYGGEFAIRIRPANASTPHGGSAVDAAARLPGSRRPATAGEREQATGRGGRDRGA